MADEMGSARATWFVLAIVGVGVLLVSSLSGHGAFRSDGAQRNEVVAVMSSAAQRSEGGQFHGADISALMGSSLLDLTRAELAAGQEATVDIFAIMGSVTIRVPDGWTIDTRAIPILGGIRDNRWPAATVSAQAVPSGDLPRLVLRGFVMMGSIFVKS